MLTGPAFLFLLSIGLQLAAALLALRLIRITGRKGAWILISRSRLPLCRTPARSASTPPSGSLSESPF
ncbi:MAG: hypothetical protein HY039_07080 [Nitrospirae bacterium]|nr:hypothetical protein [Nitrospirota bacterium]